MLACSLDVIDRNVRGFPGGVPAMAIRLGKHQGTLRSELKPPVGSVAKLGWLDALQVMDLCHQVGMRDAYAPLDVVERERGRVFISTIPIVDGVAQEGLAARVARLAKEFSDFMSEVAMTSADGVVSDNELTRARVEGVQLVAEVQHMLATLEGMNDASKLGRLRAVGA